MLINEDLPTPDGPAMAVVFPESKSFNSSTFSCSSALVKIICNYVLVGLPELGILGAPIGTSLCYLVILCINLINIRRLNIPFSLWRAFARPLISALVMGAFVLLIYPPLTGFLGGFWIFFGVVLVMVLAPVIYSYILHKKGI